MSKLVRLGIAIVIVVVAEAWRGAHPQTLGALVFPMIALSIAAVLVVSVLPDVLTRPYDDDDPCEASRRDEGSEVWRYGR